MAKRVSKSDKSDGKTKSAEMGHRKTKSVSRKDYEAELFKLQAELVKLQHWVVEKGHRAVIVFEGRDAAGKGGVIKRITDRVSPRVFRVVVLPMPSGREKYTAATASPHSGPFPSRPVLAVSGAMLL